MLRLKDIVELDTKGEFRSDVQLSDYDKPSLNRSLLQSYIFSTSVPSTYGARTQAVAALDLLDHLMKAFQYERFENRFVAIANYGHGKSHLALVLANYFARPVTSPEVQTIFERIDHAVSNPAKAQNFRDFKEQRGEFLVLRLRGDDPRPLREQFFRALKQALAEHEQTHSVELPFWVKQAANYLRSLKDEQLRVANDYLQQYTLDVPALLQDIQEYREQAFEYYVDLFAHLNYGVRPNLEGHVSLSEAIEWAVKEFCDEKRALFGGVLILFDEFSLYIQRYARDRAAGELQELLQGVEDHRRKVAFLAFAQHDPDEVAIQAVHGGQSLQSLKKELGRLPKRFALYSLMESVLDAYLKQSPDGWNQLLSTPGVRGLVFGETTEVVWDTFSKHYQEELGWNHDKFREVVIEGCFPLHPMTTALLCHLKMQQGEDIGAARTVLGFVRDQLDFYAERPAYSNGRVNWVLPIALVDYFEHRLTGDMPALHQSFCAALRNAEQILGDNITEDHRSVLKALLLLEAARLPLRRKQVELLAHLSGLDERTTLTVLKELSDQNIIRYDPANRLNSFWPVGTDPKRLEQAIREEIERINLDESGFIRDLNQALWGDETYNFGSLPVDISWGHPDDWAADEYIITLSILDRESLQSRIPPFKLTKDGLGDGRRGLVLWLLSEDEAERPLLYERVRAVMAEAWPEPTPPPVVALLPRQPVPGLREFFFRLKALERIGKQKDLVKEIGFQTYENELGRTKGELRRALKRMRGDDDHVWDIQRRPGEIVVPQAYQAAVDNIVTRGSNVKNVLSQLYDLAYQKRPPEFFTQYAAQAKGSNKLRLAVKVVAKNLLFDRIGDALNGMEPGVPKDLCEKYLSKKWRMLSPAYSLQKPAVQELQLVWDWLDQTFAPGVQDVPLTKVVPQLLNPPYGFDYNTAMLLLCGWIGYHQSELLLSRQGARIGLGDLERQIESTRAARDFLNWACVSALAISRREPGAARQEVQKILDRVAEGVPFSQAEADEALQVLNEFLAQKNQPPEVHQQATEAADRLRDALEATQKYDWEAQQILASLNTPLEAFDLLEQRQKLTTLATDNLVITTQPAVSEIEQVILDRLERALETEYRRVEELADITLVGTLDHRLRILKSQLEEQGLVSYTQQVATIEDALQKRAEQLKATEREADIKKEIEAMTADAGLITLYNYRQRLHEMQLVSPGLKQARDRKLEVIQGEIIQLEGFATSITEQVQNIDLNSTQPQEMQKSVIQHQNRYIGTQYEEKLSQALDYLETLQQFCAEVHNLKQLPLRSPQDVRLAEEKIKQIASSFEQWLSPFHLGVLDQVYQDISRRAQVAQQEAIHWLEAREREVEHNEASFSDLQRRLENPPAFLPVECQPRLEALRAYVQERLDQDLIAQIEFLFQSLGTSEKREECLNRLRQLVAESEYRE
jgi:predicted transcriptional regulator